MAFLDDVASFSCNGQSKTGTTLAGSITGAGAAIGKLVIVVVASDNAGTTDATGADNIASVTDSGGNTYKFAAGFRNGQSAAQGGSHSSVWYSVITTALSVGSTITVTNSTSAYARAFYARAYSFGAGNAISVAGSIGAAGDGGVDPVANLTGLTSKEYLFIGTASDENSATIASTVSGWTYKGGLVTSGGATATNMAVALWIAIETGTGKSLTPATVGDAAALVVAFAEFQPTADGWNSADKSANITLSGGDKTATLSTSVQGGVRSTQLRAHGSAGKYYAEWQVGSIATFWCGILGISQSVAVDTSSIEIANDGQIYQGVTKIGTTGGAYAANDVACMALDTGAKLIWFRQNGGLWNNSGTANPATGTGGLSSAVVATESIALVFQNATATANATIRTKLADYTQTVPSGFQSWMGETPSGGGVTVNATGVAAGTAVGTATVTTVRAVNVAATGVSALARVGTATVTTVGAVNVAATGVSALARVGTATVTTGGLVPWTPAEIGTDLIAWYDFADAATVIQSGGFLTEWRDKSGNARHGVPLGTNTLSVNSDGIYIANATAGTNLAIQMPTLPSAYFDFAFAGKPNPFGGSGSYRTLIANQAGNYHHILLETGTNNLGTYSGAAAFIQPGGLTWPSVDGQIYFVGPSATGIKIGKDGATPIDEVGENFNPDPNPCLLNYAAAGTQGWGTAREFVFMTASQPQGIQEKISGYLAWKWDGILGVTTHVAALPAGHPYKSAPPMVGGGPVNVTATPTGVNAAAAQGTATATGVINISTSATGVAAATALGTATAIGIKNVASVATGVSAAALAGTASAIGIKNVSSVATGVAAATALGSADATTPAALNPAGWDSSIETYEGLIVFSNEDRTATGLETLGIGQLLSVTAHSGGKQFVEIDYPLSHFIGVYVPGVWDGAYLDGATGDIYIYTDGGATSVTFPGVFTPLAAGDVVGIAADFDAGKVWFRVNGGPWNNDPLQGPV